MGGIWKATKPTPEMEGAETAYLSSPTSTS
jgi:hypothetical protein